MLLEVLCDGATSEQLRLGRQAAHRVLIESDVSMMAAWEAIGRWHAWDDRGRLDEDALSLADQRAMHALKSAEDAANEAMGFPPSERRAVLDWIGD